MDRETGGTYSDASSNLVEQLGNEGKDNAERASHSAILAYKRYKTTGNMADIEDAVEKAQIACRATSDGDSSLVNRLINLTLILETLYERTEKLCDLEEVIRVGQQAVDATPQNHLDRVICLNDLGNNLESRYERTSKISDLKDAIQIAQQAVDAAPQNHPSQIGCLNNLSNKLIRLYEQTGEISDLEKAIQIAQQVVDSTPKDHPSRAGRLNNLANKLKHQYELTGEISDLEKAIQIAQQAVDATPQDHPDRASHLNSLGVKLESRYVRTGHMRDLEEAIQIARQAVHLTQNHLSRADHLNNLGNMLGRRYDGTGETRDLEEAIEIAQQAVDLTPQNYLYRIACLNNLGSKLESRYERTGQISDLEKAIEVAQQAVDSTPQDHPNRAGRLNNLGSKLESRYIRIGEMGDLEEAIRIIRQAVNLTPHDHPNQAIYLSSLGSKLSRRHKRIGEIGDLEEAIQVTQQAVKSTSHDHPNRAGYLINLGNRLYHQYELTGEISGLEEAVQVTRQALDSTPKDHLNRADYLNSLGSSLRRRYERVGEIHDLELALDCFVQSSQSLQAIPLTRVQAARSAIRILWEWERWDQAMSLAKEAVKLIPLVCGRYLSREDQQHAIVQISGLAADACSLSLKVGDVEQAIQQLEFGRGVILGYMMDNRSDLSALKRDCPSLAERFETLRYIASRPIDAQQPAIRDELLKKRREAMPELDDCLHQIRQIPSYKRFLLEPTIGELTRCAVEGPIVIVNVTSIGTHAIIVSVKGVKALPLTEMSPAKAPLPLRQLFRRYRSLCEGQYINRDMESETESRRDPDFLSWLWRSCVNTILKEMVDSQILSYDNVSRVWWIGTGIASSFPFHAAGCYYEGSLENTLSRVIPSYTPTIKVLAYSRSHAQKRTQSNSEKNTSVLIVMMPTTPGQRSLDGVDREKLIVDEACKDVYSCKVLKCPTAQQVLEDMARSDIIHFACHGASDPTNPSDSHLLLQRIGVFGPVVDRLTVSNISNIEKLGRAWIAYLSACSTAEVKASSLADEGLHIVSAFQVAGFAHVIGSLWSVDDDVCAQVARLFYEDLTKSSKTLYSNRSVAAALRSAVLQVRSTCDPSIWAAFIHSGA